MLSSWSVPPKNLGSRLLFSSSSSSSSSSSPSLSPLLETNCNSTDTCIINNNEQYVSPSVRIVHANKKTKLSCSTTTSKKKSATTTTTDNDDDVPNRSTCGDSTCSNVVVGNGGRGLIASKDIQPGEVLFVLTPTVSVNIEQAIRLYNNTNTKNKSLEHICETILIKEMKRSIKSSNSNNSKARDCIAASFLTLQSSHNNDDTTNTTNNTTTPSKKKSDGDNNDATEIGEEEYYNYLDGEDDDYEKHNRFVSLLLGQGHPEDVQRILKNATTKHNNVTTILNNNDYLLGIIRHNAFGPDFHNYDRMETYINRSSNHNNDNGSDNDRKKSCCYSRVLGHYPFAAMINHSCCSNTTRVFYTGTTSTNISSGNSTSTEMMIATASQYIPKNTEIVWPYCPPTYEYTLRQQLLYTTYGFICYCQRCQFEKVVYEQRPPPKVITDLTATITSSSLSQQQQEQQLTVTEWSTIIKSLRIWYNIVIATVNIDDCIITDDNDTEKDITHKQQKQELAVYYLRLGYTQLYMRYTNEMLTVLSSSSIHDEELIQAMHNTIRIEAKELHQSFSSVHKSSTEHLSLCHLCYELLSSASNSNNDKKKMTEIKYWTNELKDLHIARYSNTVIGNNNKNNNNTNTNMLLLRLRSLMKHTRAILRTKDGWYNSNNNNTSTSTSPFNTSFI